MLPWGCLRMLRILDICIHAESLKHASRNMPVQPSCYSPAVPSVLMQTTKFDLSATWIPPSTLLVTLTLKIL